MVNTFGLWILVTNTIYRACAIYNTCYYNICNNGCNGVTLVLILSWNGIIYIFTLFSCCYVICKWKIRCKRVCGVSPLPVLATALGYRNEYMYMAVHMHNMHTNVWFQRDFNLNFVIMLGNLTNDLHVMVHPSYSGATLKLTHMEHIAALFNMTFNGFGKYIPLM